MNCKTLFETDSIQRCDRVVPLSSDDSVGRYPRGMNQNRITAMLLFLVAVFLPGGCDLYEQDEYEEFYVVESYLVVNAPLPQVRVSRTLPINEQYSFAKAAIGDATVSLQMLDEAGNPSTSYAYEQQTEGIYTSVDSQTIVQGARRYRLLVSFPNGDSVQAETLVPGNFRTLRANADTVTYQGDPQFEITTTPSEYPGRQTYFIFTVNVVEPAAENLTPIYADFIDDDDELSDFLVNSSGIINEQNYVRNSDNSLTVRLPWIGVAFYNANDVIINAIDDNMYDFLRSQDVQTGGTALPPGEIQNVVYNVEGGIGIFGSMASDTNRVFISRPRPQF